MSRFTSSLDMSGGTAAGPIAVAVGSVPVQDVQLGGEKRSLEVR